MPPGIKHPLISSFSLLVTESNPFKIGFQPSQPPSLHCRPLTAAQSTDTQQITPFPHQDFNLIYFILASKWETKQPTAETSSIWQNELEKKKLNTDFAHLERQSEETDAKPAFWPLDRKWWRPSNLHED